ncbi:MAG: vWA domain-containing protein [Lachnospiraceae bacterium]
MGSKSKHNAKEQNNIALQYFEQGLKMVDKHPLFSPLLHYSHLRYSGDSSWPKDGYAKVMSDGLISCNTKRRAAPEEWARVIAHCLLHLGMEHFVEKDNMVAWNIACDCVVEKFLTGLKFGKPFYNHILPGGISDEVKLYDRLCRDGIKSDYCGFGTNGPSDADLAIEYARTHPYWYNTKKSWPQIFASGLSNAVKSAVMVSSGYQSSLSADLKSKTKSIAEEAKQWFISSYPLLGAIAANFKLIEDPLICQRMDISIAAVSPGLSELYMNPAAGLTKDECRFVMAHEFLHAALRHDVRQQWRDAYLWNIACDFVINLWLTEMGIGERPAGLLYDEQFKGQNAESIYDRIVTDMRTYRKLATLRGVGLGDVLTGAGQSGDVSRRIDIDLDGFYRRALSQGLEYHQEQSRGYLPEGLIEEIRALSHPPIPWDVELARWFDEQFVPLEKKRSYARPSRRQSSTPDIPRPSWVIPRRLWMAGLMA